MYAINKKKQFYYYFQWTVFFIYQFAKKKKCVKLFLMLLNWTLTESVAVRIIIALSGCYDELGH